MRIIITKDKFYDEDQYLSSNYDLNATLETDDDATATDVAKMVVAAMRIEGYYDSSIKKALDYMSEDLDG